MQTMHADSRQCMQAGRTMHGAECRTSWVRTFSAVESAFECMTMLSSRAFGAN